MAMGVVLLLLINIGAALSQDIAVAKFSMKGVNGSVTFTSSGQDTQTTLSLTVTKSYSWEIRQFPVILGLKDPCNDTKLGDQLHNLTDSQSAIDSDNSDGTVTLSNVPLFSGDKAISGRSLVLKSDKETVCATILAADSPVAYSVVNGYVAGDVHVFKVGDRYAILTDLFNTQKAEEKSYQLKLFSGKVTSDLATSSPPQPDVGDRCKKVEGATVVATIDSVPVAAAGQTRKSWNYVTITEESFDFSRSYLKIPMDEDDMMVCSNFHLFERKQVSAVYNREGVQGEIVFTQDSPYTSTTMEIKLNGLRNLAGGYHVHEYPINYPYGGTGDSSMCAASETGGHFSPLDVRAGPTQDYAEIGDLSRKHGSFADKNDVSMSYEDLFLPLFGENSIVGRSIVIHAADDGARWLCSNIGYPGPVITAVAEFDAFAVGSITFVQQKDKPWADTTIFVQLSNAGVDSTASKEHKYHIHTSPTNGDELNTSERCLSTDGHWNPYQAMVSDSGIYKPACAKSKLGCEVGDLSQKFGLIDLEATGSVKKYFYTDSIPLSGAYSIISRSITIHLANAQPGRYACADIRRQIPVVVTTDGQWSNPDEDELSGSIRFEETSSNGVTSQTVDLKKTNKIAGPYHVHELPLDTNTAAEKICLSTKGHYNPYGADLFTPGSTFDKYEIGDLSNKHGSLANKTDVTETYEDTNLPLRGSESIAGRSIVIHRTDASRWKCSNLIWDEQAMNGALVQGIAVFEGDITGYILLSQLVGSDGASDVNIQTMLSYKDPSMKTENHKWHVHENTVEGDGCTSVGGHYNPFNVDVSSSNYAARCEADERMCEVGDLSNKFEKMNIDGIGKVYNDDFLQLHGRYSVLSRSIVIHDKDAGAKKIACADIIPFGKSFATKQFYIKTPQDAFKDKMAAEVAGQLGVPQRYIYVKKGDTMKSCTAVTVYFSGPQAESMKSKLNDVDLGDFSRSLDCENDIGGAISPSMSWIILPTLLMAIVIPQF